MSNTTFTPYFDYPVNPVFLFINCTICKKNYSDSNYAKELYNGDPAYYLLVNNSHIHFCSAKCASEYLNKFK